MYSLPFPYYMTVEDIKFFMPSLIKELSPYIKDTGVVPYKEFKEKFDEDDFNTLYSEGIIDIVTDENNVWYIETGGFWKDALALL